MPGGAPAATRGFRNVVRALANRNYRIYAVGNFVSLCGTWLQRIAVGWLAWQLTRSGAWLGIVAFADLFPTVVLSPFAGTLADRRDRLALLKVTQSAAMAQAIGLAAMTFAGAMTIGWLVALSLTMGVVNAFNQPARLALIPSLVERAELPAAVAINSTIFNGARFLGPAAAGAVIAHGSIGLAFALNAASFVVFLIALHRVRLIEDETPPAARRGFLSDSLEGYAYVARHPGIGPMIVLLAATSIGSRAYVELLPGFADAVFGRGAQALAWLTATTGLGAMVGGILMASRGGGAGLTRVVIANVLLMAVALLGFTATTSFWVALACVFVAGFSLVINGIGGQTLVQTAVDSTMRGRVMSLYGMIFRGGPALGVLIMGSASTRFGLRLPVACGALLCAGFWLWARLRRERIAAALES
ncbi:MAG TPA: MFS transporter [Candidatus Sulfotelmatobacter sp.]|nr:MFS transporter [Candidatus Sulfotelmatobacter sp.]